MQLAFDDGGGSGRPVVSLPMFGTTRALMATALGPALATDGVREIYLDLPGHGDSPRTDRANSETVLQTVVEWLEDHLDSPVRLVGGSYGGYLAAAVARRRPDLVSGLLLICPGVRMRRPLRDLPTERPAPGPGGWLDGAPEPLRDHLDQALGNRTAAVVSAVARALESGGPGDDDYLDSLYADATLDDEDAETLFLGPVTVLAGRQDRMVGWADQFRAMRCYPRGTFAVLDNAGHYLPFEQPDLVRAHAQIWLRRED